jgi:hypothetical protein
MRFKIALIPLLLAAALISFGQTQLVLLKKEKILARFTYGDNFTYKLKNSKDFETSFITDVREFSVVTFNDTILFSSIERVSLKGHPQKRFSTLSKFLITAGILYFTIDEVNHMVIQGQKPDLDPAVWKPSIVLVSAGYVLKLFRKRSQRIRFPSRLMAAQRGSRFYQYDQ